MAEESQDQPDTTEPSDERKAELEAVYERQKETASPYMGARIHTLGELQWIMARRHWSGDFLLHFGLQRANLSGSNLYRVNLSDSRLVEVNLSDSRLVEVNLSGAHLDNANLRGADLGGANLSRARLSTANLSDANLSGANLSEAKLSEANLNGAFLGEANLSGASLGEANLSGAHLVRANLSGAHLVRANLSGANLERANLSGANLERANLSGANLERANLIGTFLRRATLDFKTDLTDVILSDHTFYLADVSWGGASLVSVDWDPVHHIGDETTARIPKDDDDLLKSSEDRLREWKTAVRAYRLLATALRSQGMNEESDRFAFRAQLCQRQVYRFQRKRWRAAWSGFLNVLAGYGYQPQRTVGIYIALVLLYALTFWLVGHTESDPLSPVAALVFSVTSFHGRGFFPGNLRLDDPVVVIAASEAIVGLVIEISFIATFTQRFFGR